MDWSNPVGSAISGSMGLIGSAINYNYQSKLQDKQNQFNLDMWNLQNEYNSPQAQMKRYEEAGLNPALIYSQGNPGNAASAPVQGVPDAPELSHDMRELGQAFNIEGLKTAIANRKKAENEADITKSEAENARTESERNKDKYEAEVMFGNNYVLNPATGQFVFAPRSGGEKISARASSWYYLNRLLADNYRTNSLLVPRANLIGSQSKLNTQRFKYLVPQTAIANFNAEPWRLNTNFIIGNVKNGAQALSALVPMFPF